MGVECLCYVEIVGYEVFQPVGGDILVFRSAAANSYVCSCGEKATWVDINTLFSCLIGKMKLSIPVPVNTVMKTSSCVATSLMDLAS